MVLPSLSFVFPSSPSSDEGANCTSTLPLFRSSPGQYMNVRSSIMDLNKSLLKLNTYPSLIISSQVYVDGGGLRAMRTLLPEGVAKLKKILVIGHEAPHTPLSHRRSIFCRGARVVPASKPVRRLLVLNAALWASG